MDYRERYHDLIKRIHIARRDALRDFKKIEKIQLNKEAELILIAGSEDFRILPSTDMPSVMGIPIERVPEGEEFKLITA